MDHRRTDLEPDSWLVAGGRTTEAGAPLNVPLIPASNFLQGAGRAYARDDGTPTWEALEQVVGGLEAGEAVAFASGMAAVAAVFEQIPAGAVVVLPEDVYQGVVGVAAAGAAKGRWTVERIAGADTAGWIRAAADAALLWLESPSNPLLEVADLEAICIAPRKAGAIVAVDNTFATPLNQQPLELGATVAVQSATKLLGGHSDLLCGIATTRDTGLAAALRHCRELTGATPGALEAYLVLRGVRTLALRLERAQATALALAEWLERHPRVERVRYPGLASHPTHTVAKRVLRGFGTVVSFDVAGGAAAADAVCRATRLVRHATSLGGVESTMERRAAIPGQEHLPPGLLRLSVGIENAADLRADLDRALAAAATRAASSPRRGRGCVFGRIEGEMGVSDLPPLPGVDPATAPSPDDPGYDDWIESVVFTPEGVDRLVLWESLHRTPTERLRALQDSLDALRPERRGSDPLR